MKLTDFNVALRNLKGNPFAKIRIGPEDTVGLILTVEKSKLMSAIKERFVERSAETGLRLTDEGEIKLESTND